MNYYNIYIIIITRIIILIIIVIIIIINSACLFFGQQTSRSVKSSSVLTSHLFGSQAVFIWWGLFFLSVPPHRAHTHTASKPLYLCLTCCEAFYCLFRFQFHHFNSSLQDHVSQRVLEMASNQMSLFLSHSKGQWETSPSHLGSNISSCLIWHFHTLVLVCLINAVLQWY